MRKYFMLLLLTMLSLSGCSIVEADRIYTTCQISDGVVIAYNDKLEFVQVTSDGTILPHGGGGVTARPVLTFHPNSSDGYMIDSTDVPNKYKATLESVEKYVGRLLMEDATYEVTYVTWRELDLLVHSTEWHCRVLWDIEGNLRLYFVDNYSNPIEPLYLNEEL